ncbi:MAG: DUF1572 family protein [Planctomycetaceae bacterium]
MSATSLPKIVLDELVQLFRDHKQFAEKAVVQVSDEDLHKALHPETNSIAVIMKHIAGNLVSRFTDFLTTDGEKPDRNRDHEFVDDFRSRHELLDYWERGWDCLFSALAGLTPADLEQTVTIRGEPHSVVKALDRSIAHLAYHVGQIVLIARIHAGENWNVMTIPRGGSDEFNRKTWKQ